MIVTFKNKMIVTFGPWLKGEGAWSAHLPLRTLRRTTTNDDDDDEDEASPSGPGSRGGCLVSTPASEITVTLYIPTTTTTNDDDEDDM